MATLQSFGADEVVTGSCHILELDNGTNIMVDCGMFQGRYEKKNFEAFGFDPKKIDVLLVTHAHLDHVGRIPKLVKEGFKGKIIATKPTFEMANIVLLDSAHLMTEEYNTRYKKAQRRGEEQKIHLPLYRVEDVEDVFMLPHLHAEYDKTIKIAKGIKVTYRNAGHILGSATIQIDYKEDKKTKTIVFSGDLGNKRAIVMPKTEIVGHAGNLVIESTYGDRNHKPLNESIKEFKKAVRDTLLNRGNVIIPSFAIERTQDVLCILKDMYYKKELPECKVFLDSPMAIRSTSVFSKYYKDLSKRCKDFYKKSGDVFDFPGLHFTQDVEDSKKINKVDSGAVIIAGSGMCNGGRILHHFKNRLWNERNCVIFVGYQAEGTLGRRIVDGEKWVHIYREKIIMRAKSYTINGFSAHADQSELLAWMKGFDTLGHIYLVHGEKDKQLVFKDVIKKEMNKKAHMVVEGEKIAL